LDVASLVTLLLLALALAVQPWSVLAAVLLVTSERGVAKAVAFAAGWVLALTVVAVAVVALYPATPEVTSSSPWVSWVQLGSGAALAAWLYVRSRAPALPKSEAQPRWMARLDSMSPWPAFLLGAFLPNYVIVVAAVGDVLQAGLTQVWTAVVLLLFILVASAGVAIPLLVLVFRREDAPAIYARWRAWLVARGQVLVVVVLTVVAVVLMAKGVVGLLS
jgi:threonine/homoserine/homoserine lactone efflux protein